jgi:hypothetical protein
MHRAIWFLLGAVTLLAAMVVAGCVVVMGAHGFSARDQPGATQNLSDGELFYIIQNGIRLTGMPAWGSGSHHDTEDSWKLVRFIRHLP